MIPLQPPRRYLEPDFTDDNFLWHADCRYFNGGLPCRFWRPCLGCSHHDPVDHRVLIVMLGLHGDILIASPVPARIKQERPGVHITWLTDDAHAPLLRMNPYVDRVLSFNWQSAVHLPAESFDAIYSFERTPAAAALVDRIPAAHKSGLAYGGPHNTLYAIGEAAQHFFKMNIWNDYRTITNTKTWTELYFEVAGYTYAGEPYVLQIPPAADRRVRTLLSDELNMPRIGMNVGSSLTTKMWPEDHWQALGEALLDRGYQLVITGGAKEEQMCTRLYAGLSVRGGTARVRYAPLVVEEFSAVAAYCDVVVTGDTFGFHVALAHERPCVLLLGPSNDAEVIPKHVTTIFSLKSTLRCSPCAHQVACGGAGGCMGTIQPSEVIAAVADHLETPESYPPRRTVNDWPAPPADIEGA
ncbi:MAG: glycosyltransferase family 9 protein [Pseudonocardiaceae bacterium]